MAKDNYQHEYYRWGDGGCGGCDSGHAARVTPPVFPTLVPQIATFRMWRSGDLLPLSSRSLYFRHGRPACWYQLVVGIIVPWAGEII